MLSILWTVLLVLAALCSAGAKNPLPTGGIVIREPGSSRIKSLSEQFNNAITADPSLGQTGLYVERVPSANKQRYDAEGEFYVQRAFIKCRPPTARTRHEQSVLQLLQPLKHKDTRPDEINPTALVPKLLHQFLTMDGQLHCLVLSHGGNSNVLQFMQAVDLPAQTRLMANIMLRLLNTVAYLNRHGIAHTNIRPENLLIQPDISEFDAIESLQSATIKLMLLDYGDAVLRSQSRLNVYLAYWRRAKDGSPYRPPESIYSFAGACKHDAWSIGVMIYQLISFQLPYGKDARIPADAGKGKERADRPRPTDALSPATALTRDYLRIRFTRKHHYVTPFNLGANSLSLLPMFYMMKRLMAYPSRRRPTPNEYLARPRVTGSAQRSWLTRHKQQLRQLLGRQ